MKNLTDDDFDRTVGDSRMLLVDFWAEWCAPCRTLAPVLEEVEKEYDGRLAFAKMDVSKNKAVSSRLKITAIPTMILFKNGIQVNSIIGAVSKEKIKGMVNEHL